MPSPERSEDGEGRGESGRSAGPNISLLQVLAGTEEDCHCEKFSQTSSTKTVF